MKQILYITYYETIHIFKDKILLVLIFFVPLLYAFFFGAVYSQGILTGIPLAVVDLDHSALSREVIKSFENSPRFSIVQDITTYPLLEEGMRKSVIRAGVVIPENFARDADLNRGTEILTVYDGSNLIWGYNIRKYTLEVVNQFNTGHASSYMAGLGLTKKEITNILDTLSTNIDVWYNPTFSYTSYMLYGLIMLVIHQICLLSASLTVTREKEKNCWIQFLSSPLPAWKIFLGKSLPYFLTGFFNYVLLIWFITRFVQIKIEGSVFLMALLGLLYTVVIISAGFYISLKAKNSLQATRFIMLLSVPLLMVSGYTWPQTHIPAFINNFASLIPFTWMAEGFRNIAVKDLGAGCLTPVILALSLMSITAVLLAVSFAKRKNRPMKIFNDHF
ncbi:MAG: Inner membrane transport permease YbhR [Firmicutes bacterium ADurb.Bin373]|nr:MAG: Inner membrane transport permease YbhR [Firmicutes bacterium ADurb.Bin373]